jgi:hypothetical protein
VYVGGAKRWDGRYSKDVTQFGLKFPRGRKHLLMDEGKERSVNVFWGRKAQEDQRSKKLRRVEALSPFLSFLSKSRRHVEPNVMSSPALFQLSLLLLKDYLISLEFLQIFDQPPRSHLIPPQDDPNVCATVDGLKDCGRL